MFADDLAGLVAIFPRNPGLATDLGVFKSYVNRFLGFCCQKGHNLKIGNQFPERTGCQSENLPQSGNTQKARWPLRGPTTSQDSCHSERLGRFGNSHHPDWLRNKP
jgi:hypothetical protein